VAFSEEAAAKAAEAAHGGTKGSFDDALRQSYADMAKDTVMIRKSRSERRQRMMQKG